MKKILIIALLALLGCAGNKPVPNQTNSADDDPRCVKLMKLPKITIESLTMPVLDMGVVETCEQCPCHETIVCNGIEYCSAFKCSYGIEEPVR
jgi:hypothetical protein